MRKYIYISILGFLSIFLTGCFEKKEQVVQKKEIRDVVVANPIKKNIEIWDEYTARLEGESQVEIRARVNGYLEKICFKDGDYVKEGDVLFEIDPAPFKTIVVACQANVSETSARTDLTKSNLERAKQLFENNAISKESLETRKSEYLSAIAAGMNAQAKLDEAILNLKFTKVRAPISGYISRRYVDVGNLITNANTLLATIVSRDVIYAYFQVSERDIIRYDSMKLFKSIDSKKGIGPLVKIKLMNESDFSHSGILTYVDNTLNAASIEMRANIPNKNGSLFPGMFAKLKLRAGEPSEKILVPELALGTDLLTKYLFVVNNENIVEYRKVKIGERVGELRVIEDGLMGDEKIIVKGVQKVRADMKVNPTFEAK